MRIAISSWSRRHAGGVESYLAALVPPLRQRGHALALVHEVDEPADRRPLFESSDGPSWCLAAGADAALDNLARWRPDVIFAHGLEDPALESRVSSLAPTVFFAHAYRGTCISGKKTFSTPDYQACTRALGWPCLAHYLPRGCGGRSPATMMQLYQRESKRRDGLGRYHAVVALSRHIAGEYGRHGVASDRIHLVPAPLDAPAGILPRTLRPDGPVHLLFVGRMEALKGGDRLLEALPRVQARLQRPVHATFIGDGRRREEWQTRAADAVRGPEIAIEFTGWLSPADRDRRFADADLLVVPSVWPEPFGLVGLEAAGHGIPAAAFALGGIPEWLKDGASGALAPADPPRAEALAEAISACLSDTTTYQRLSAGALAVAATHSMDAHLGAVLRVLDAAHASQAERVLA